MKKLLILCTGNTCRSPMAGILATYLLREQGNQEVEIRTAGLSAFPGSTASSQAVEVMEERGLDLTGHLAEPITLEMINWADLILTMTWEHKKRLLFRYPQAQGKVFTLKEYGEPAPEAQRLMELETIIAQREQAFLDSHRNELDRLLRHQRELRQELQGIEAELAKLEMRLAEEVSQEKQELVALEQKLARLDIPDPFGGTVEDYRETAQAIEEALGAVLDRLQNQ